MLTHPTLDQLHRLGLLGMAKAFGEAETSNEAAALTHPEWLGLLLDREMTYRHDKKLTARLRYARLRQQAAACGCAGARLPASAAHALRQCERLVAMVARRGVAGRR